MDTLTRLRKSLLTTMLILLLATGGVSLAKQDEAPRGETEQADLPRVENAKLHCCPN
jgi:hypothetical protein